MKSLFILLIVGVAFAEDIVEPTGEDAPEDIEYNEEDYDDTERGISAPNCFHQHNTASCCLNINIKGHNGKTCVELAFRPNEMKAVATVKINDRNLFSKDASVGKLCAPLPAPLTMLKGCLHVYYADLSVPRKTADVCFLVEVEHITQVSFGCFRMSNGKFQHHNEHPPEKHGFINVSFGHHMKPSVHVNVPKVGKTIGKTVGKTVGKIFHG